MPSSDPSHLTIIPLWERTAAMVGELLEGHRLLRPIRDVIGPVRVEATPRAIWATAAAGTLVARIDGSSWWEPGLDTMEDQAQQIARRLAVELHTGFADWSLAICPQTRELRAPSTWGLPSAVASSMRLGSQCPAAVRRINPRW